jgi:hypothetical protein
MQVEKRKSPLLADRFLSASLCRLANKQNTVSSPIQSSITSDPLDSYASSPLTSHWRHVQASLLLPSYTLGAYGYIKIASLCLSGIINQDTLIKEVKNGKA